MFKTQKTTTKQKSDSLIVLQASLSRDPVSPVLIQPHLAALDRRLLKILQSLQDCTEQEGRTLQQVVIDDGVY